MKFAKHSLSLALVLLLLVCILPAAYADTGFADVSDDAWYASAVVYCKENGIMNGTAAAEFSPDAAISRGMFVTVLYRIAGEPAVNGENPFTDVSDTSFCAKAVIWAAENGITLGYGNSQFKPNLEINREQMACMLERFCTAIAAPFAENAANDYAYADADLISSFAKSGVDFVGRTGLMLGYTDKSFRPFATTTRAQAAVVFVRLSEKLKADMPATLTVVGDDSSCVYILMKSDADKLSEYLASMEKNDLYAEYVPTHVLTIGGISYSFEISAPDNYHPGCNFKDADGQGHLNDKDGAMTGILGILAKYTAL